MKTKNICNHLKNIPSSDPRGHHDRDPQRARGGGHPLVGVDPRGPRRHPRPLRHHLLPLQGHHLDLNPSQPLVTIVLTVRILQTSAT